VSTLDALLQTSAKSHPDRPALAWGEAQTKTYRDLSAAVERLAHALSVNVEAGQPVAVLASNTPALVVGLFAAWRRGAVAVPLNARWREYELRRILQDAEPAALVSIESYQGYSFASLLSRLLPELPTIRGCYFIDSQGELKWNTEGPGAAGPGQLNPEIGLILYTSGTTGAPKGALVRHSRELAGARAVNDVLGTTAEDVTVFVIPISHAFGMTTFLGTVAAGGLAVLVESAFTLNPLLEAVQRWRATLLHGSPALFTSFLKLAPTPPATLRTGFVAGSACPPPVLEQLDRVGLRVLNLYGMTEIGAAACCRPDDSPHDRYHTVGRPLTGYQIRVSGSQSGEVLVRGPYVTPGYYRQLSRASAGAGDTGSAIALDAGWFRTGDLGSLDERGNLRVSGRAKEVIHVGGFNVFPGEVEGFLLTHPDVLQAAVLGVPHDVMGEAVKAFIVPRPGSNLTAPALLQYARPRIAGYKLPFVIRLLAEMPLLATGKPDRAALALTE
jgi:acyl-CoA synthetase (AMP-forming)/AMP-acid ligase II